MGGAQLDTTNGQSPPKLMKDYDMASLGSSSTFLDTVRKGEECLFIIIHVGHH